MCVGRIRKLYAYVTCYTRDEHTELFLPLPSQNRVIGAPITAWLVALEPASGNWYRSHSRVFSPETQSPIIGPHTLAFFLRSWTNVMNLTAAAVGELLGASIVSVVKLSVKDAHLHRERVAANGVE